MLLNSRNLCHLRYHLVLHVLFFCSNTICPLRISIVTFHFLLSVFLATFSLKWSPAYIFELPNITRHMPICLCCLLHSAFQCWISLITFAAAFCPRSHVLIKAGLLPSNSQASRLPSRQPSSSDSLCSGSLSCSSSCPFFYLPSYKSIGSSHIRWWSRFPFIAHHSGCFSRPWTIHLCFVLFSSFETTNLFISSFVLIFRSSSSLPATSPPQHRGKAIESHDLAICSNCPVTIIMILFVLGHLSRAFRPTRFRFPLISAQHLLSSRLSLDDLIAL